MVCRYICSYVYTSFLEEIKTQDLDGLLVLPQVSCSGGW